MNLAIIFALGVLVGAIFTGIVFRLLLVGTLRVDHSDPDGPFLFLELSKRVEAVVSKKYVVLRVKAKDKKYWWQMIQLLPSSYNQRRTVMLNYEVLANIYKSRRNHKLDEWHTFCDWIEELPYSELITGYEEEEDK